VTGDPRLVRRLREVVDLISADLDAGSLLEHLSQSALELFDARGACWCALEGEQLRIVTAAGLSAELVGMTYPLAGSGVGFLLEADERSVVERAQRFPHLNDRIYTGPEDRVAIALARVGGRLMGALYVTLLPEQAFGAGELEVLELLASHVGMALHHVELYAAAEQARQAQAAVVAAMADGVAVVDADGTVSSWNAAMARLTGRPEARAVGRPLPFPLPEPGEVLGARPAPGRWVDVVGSAPGPSGERVVSARDVTAAKELEEAQEVFLAATSHELRTPLTVLRGFADSLLRHWDALPDDERRDLVRRMQARTDDMTELVEKVLQASVAGLADAGREPEEFDLTGVVTAAVASLSGASQTHRVVVVDRSPVRALGRPEAVAPILDQLVENAVKHSPASGLVEVAVRAEPGAAVLTVSDRGTGISPEDAERVFDRFFRGASSTGVGGSGLGLWIVRRTVEAQGGQVAAAPRVGGGTVVHVRLPSG
jgi:signal transduction histidine kinase